MLGFAFFFGGGGGKSVVVELGGRHFYEGVGEVNSRYLGR